MKYVDGFVIPVPKKNLKAYRAVAQKAGKTWREHGALEYYECAGDDLKSKFGAPFPRIAKMKPNETVIFSWITYKSRKERDRVNAKVMKDPRMDNLMKEKPLFNFKRMSYGGFKVIVRV